MLRTIFSLCAMQIDTPVYDKRQENTNFVFIWIDWTNRN